jgi:phage-related baseplate assembly protein
LSLSEIERLYALPDLDFVEKDVDALLAEMINDYQQAYQAKTGEVKTLAPGDPVRIWIYAQALKIYAAYQLIDFAAKQNLLKYAEGDYLENLGARIGVTRNPAKAAVATERFTLSAVQNAVVSIPQGTRVSPGNNIFFKTTQYAEVPIGQIFVDIPIQCTVTGEAGNELMPGEIRTLVDPIPYVAAVANTDQSQGGAEIEDDMSLRERIFLRPDSFSVAGPMGAYIYFAKAFSQSVLDVNVVSPAPGEVNVRFILDDGELPDGAMVDEMEAYLSATDHRPLTDHVTAGAPDVVNYDIDLTYYIRTADKLTVQTIQSNVGRAVTDYIVWQKSKIGRDINPDELIARIKAAGAKRVVINTPAFKALSAVQVGKLRNKAIAYGGMEDE